MGAPLAQLEIAALAGISSLLRKPFWPKRLAVLNQDGGIEIPVIEGAVLVTLEMFEARADATLRSTGLMAWGRLPGGPIAAAPWIARWRSFTPLRPPYAPKPWAKKLIQRGELDLNRRLTALAELGRGYEARIGPHMLCIVDVERIEQAVACHLHTIDDG